MNHTLIIILGTGLFFSMLGNVGLVLAMWERQDKPHPLPDPPQPTEAVLSPKLEQQLSTFISAIDARHKEIYEAITEGQGKILSAMNERNDLLADIWRVEPSRAFVPKKGKPSAKLQRKSASHR